MNHTPDKNEDMVAEVINPGGDARVVLVCEHASAFIPPAFADLGLSGQALTSHAAWDPGALPVAKELAHRLNAPLVLSRVSRLVYDCNRPPDAPDAMPARSEVFDIPGNHALSAADREARVAQYYAPFHQLLQKTLEARPNAAVVTIHSFTPVYNGMPRDFDIGVLHDKDARFADAMLGLTDQQDRYDVRRNAPYGPQDGVTHTLKTHALPQRRLNVMIEMRNDVIATQADQTAMAGQFADWIPEALAACEESA